MSRKFLWGFFLIGVAVLVCGLFVGGAVYQKQNRKSVAFRVSTPREAMDYDFMAALAYLKKRFEESGYTVLGTAYAGRLYPKLFDRAGINVYVRGFEPFYDLRTNEKALNVFYIQRMETIYREELQRYDYYLSSQKGLKNVLKDTLKIDFLEGGAVKHEALKPSYLADVLYIYEYKNSEYEAFLQSLDAKVYSGRTFAGLSEEMKKKELSSARLVVYEMGENGVDDKDYVPYAVYDVISYGRPVLTNYKEPLERLFYQNVHWFDSKDDMAAMTMSVLALEDEKREAAALEARERLLALENEKSFFMKE